MRVTPLTPQNFLSNFIKRTALVHGFDFFFNSYNIFADLLLYIIYLDINYCAKTYEYIEIYTVQVL